ncbi:MAG: hypothetical protein WED87_09445 [Dehalococcoidia bacterium]
MMKAAGALDESVADAAEEIGRSVRQAAMLTAGVGAAHAILFIVALLLLADAPGPAATDQEFVDYYSAEGSRRVALAGLYVMPFAGIAFVWFIVALRMWIAGTQRRENALLSNVQLVSGILYTGLFFVASGASSAIAAATEFSNAPIDASFARQINQYGNTLLFVFAMRMAAMFVFTTSSIGRSARILPRWFLYVGYAVGLFLLLSASFYRVLSLVFPVWLLCLSGIMVMRARRIPRHERFAAQPSPLIEPPPAPANRSPGGS